MGNNLKEWQKYTSQLSNKDVEYASSYLIGALTATVSQKEMKDAMEDVKILIEEQHKRWEF